jgi:hypothetical protein
MKSYRASASSSPSVIAESGQTIVDSGSIPWTIDTGDVFQQNGSNTALLLYYNNWLYRKTAAGVWGYWQGAWITSRPPLPESADGATTTDSTLLVDSAGNLWDNKGNQVAENGKVDKTTSNAVLLLYYGKQIYYQNSSNDWFVWVP